MPDTRMVNIKHPQTGHEYAVLPADFTKKTLHADGKSYAEVGFEILGYEDGSEYDGPKSQREIDKVTAERAEKREAAKAEKPEPKGKADA